MGALLKDLTERVRAFSHTALARDKSLPRREGRGLRRGNNKCFVSPEDRDTFAAKCSERGELLILRELPGGDKVLAKKNALSCGSGRPGADEGVRSPIVADREPLGENGVPLPSAYGGSPSMTP